MKIEETQSEPQGKKCTISCMHAQNHIICSTHTCKTVGYSYTFTYIHILDHAVNTHVHCLGCTGPETEYYCPRKRTNPAKVDSNYTVCSYMCAHECTKRIYTSTIKKYLSFFLSSCTHSIFSDSHTSLIHTHTQFHNPT